MLSEGLKIKKKDLNRKFVQLCCRFKLNNYFSCVVENRENVTYRHNISEAPKKRKLMVFPKRKSTLKYRTRKSCDDNFTRQERSFKTFLKIINIRRQDLQYIFSDNIDGIFSTINRTIFFPALPQKSVFESQTLNEINVEQGIEWPCFFRTVLSDKIFKYLGDQVF